MRCNTLLCLFDLKQQFHCNILFQFSSMDDHGLKQGVIIEQTINKENRELVLQSVYIVQAISFVLRGNILFNFIAHRMCHKHNSKSISKPKHHDMEYYVLGIDQNMPRLSFEKQLCVFRMITIFAAVQVTGNLKLAEQKECRRRRKCGFCSDWILA